MKYARQDCVRPAIAIDFFKITFAGFNWDWLVGLGVIWRDKFCTL
jgi:hypothetical protein